MNGILIRISLKSRMAGATREDANSMSNKNLTKAIDQTFLKLVDVETSYAGSVGRNTLVYVIQLVIRD